MYFLYTFQKTNNFQLNANVLTNITYVYVYHHEVFCFQNEFKIY